jgi:hypothetical protein
LTPWRGAGERGPDSAEEGSREKPARVLPARFLGSKNEGRWMTVPRWINDYAAFLLVLGTGCGAFFAFSFAANSCFTLAVMASVSTL